MCANPFPLLPLLPSSVRELPMRFLLVALALISEPCGLPLPFPAPSVRRVLPPLILLRGRFPIP